jgi:CRISPR-associated DxTHG motif protein
VVFVTKESRERHWDELCTKLAGKITPEPVEIPWGGGSQELWTIFDRVVGAVEDGEEVLFDITHGFRSLPFVVFLALAYLRLVKNITVRGVIYGALEAGGSEKRAPVFDLSPFLGLLQWLAAVHVFRQSGIARDVARLLREIHGQVWRERPDGQLPVALQGMGARIEDVSRALLLIRPLEVMEKARELVGHFTDAAVSEAAQWAKPFALIAPALKDEIAQFAVLPSVRDIDVQLRMIDWYVRRGLLVQALTLGRELLVTKVCMVVDSGNPLQREARVRAENVLNYAAWSKQSGERRATDPWTGSQPSEADLKKFLAFDRSEQAIKLWSAIRDARNDVDHAGMNEQPLRASGLAQHVHRLSKELGHVVGGEFAPAAEPDLVTIDLSTLHDGVAKLADLPTYERRALELAGEGRTVILTGQAPIWMYLRIAHVLHGKARLLFYSSPVTGDVLVFSHDPFAVGGS